MVALMEDFFHVDRTVEAKGWHDAVMVEKLIRCSRIIVRDECLMDFFPWPHADFLELLFWVDRFGKINDLKAGGFWDKDLSSCLMLQRHQHKGDRLFNSDPEARHIHVRNRKRLGPFCHETIPEGKKRAPTAHDIAVPYD